MKNILSLSIALLSLSAVAAQAERPQANLFECKGQEVTMSYSTTSFVGQPQLSYQGPGFFIDAVQENAMGDQIESQDSVMGQLLTLNLQAIPDAGSASATLVLPEVNLNANAQPVDFDTLVLLTHHRSSFGGPQMVQGALSDTTAYQVKCKASRVAF